MFRAASIIHEIDYAIGETGQPFYDHGPYLRIIVEEICVLGCVRSRCTPETGTWRHIRAVMAAFPPVCPTRKRPRTSNRTAFDFIFEDRKACFTALTMRYVSRNG